MSQMKGNLARCSKYGPPEKTGEELKALERGFTLDCIAVATLSDDSGRSNPKMATAIPPYNAQIDRHSSWYFKKPVVKTLLTRTGQRYPGDSLCGQTMDRIFLKGSMSRYISTRNQAGAGHSVDQVGGHGLFMSNSRPFNGYNGAFGFRRNTPWLRQKPSVFDNGRIDSRSLVP